MKSFISRYLPLLLVSLLTSASLNVAYAAEDELPVDDLVSAFRNLDQSMSRGQLQQAESQLASLRQRAAGDTRLEQYQRQLAENYLQQGQSALKSGNLDNASAALGKVRALLPQAPAITSGLDDAIAKARVAELAAAQQSQQAAQQAAAKQAAAKAEQARQQKLAAERLAAQNKAAKALAASTAAAPVAPAKPQAKLIKTDAASSTISLALLDEQDNDGLRTLLSDVAADVVNFDCAVRIEVRQAKDFPWVAALLSARVKKLNPAYKLQLSQALNAEQVPQLVLTPKPE